MAIYGKNGTVATGNDSFYGESDSDLNDTYEYIYGDIASYICYYVANVLSLTVGPFLCGTIVMYEHFGADNQKRTIINRISSFIFSNITINSIIWGVLRILRDVYGLLPSRLVTWILAFHKSMQFSTILFATELAIVRFLYIVVWKRMKPINDEFWTRVLAMSTYLIALYSGLIVSFMGGFNDVGGIVEITRYSIVRKR